jgi:hypothetical protein
VLRQSRRYRQDTLILQQQIETANGAVEIIDFMPMRSGPSNVVRIVNGLRGTVAMQMMLTLRFEYGAVSPWIEHEGDVATAELGPNRVACEVPPSRTSRPALSRHLSTSGRATGIVLS